MDGPAFDAVVLAGGAARRLGGVDKMALTVGGVPLLKRVLDAAAGAERTVVVGPRRDVGGRDLVWCREDPVGGGPVAALATGLARTSAPVVLVLAGDLPGVAPAVPVLVAALGASAGVAELVDVEGRANHLAAAWRRPVLVEALAALGGPAGASMRALVAGAARVEVPDPAGWGQDCDTWEQLARAGGDAPPGQPGRPGQPATRSSPA